MTSATDGNLLRDFSFPGMGGVCRYLHARISAGLMLCLAMVLVASDFAGAHSGPVPAIVAPACRVVANQAMRISDDSAAEMDHAPIQMVEIRSEQPASANRSVRLDAGSTMTPSAAVAASPVRTVEPAVDPVAEIEIRPLSPVRLASSRQPQGGGNGNGPVQTNNNDLIASIDVQSHRAQLVNVARNSSAVVELKQRCDRAEIADPNIADIFVVSPTRVIISGRNFGTTQMILWFGDQQRVFNVAVEHDLAILNDSIRRISPTARVQPRSVNGVIVLTGTVPDAQSAERIGEVAMLYQGGEIRNQLTVAGVQQTMLRCVVAEVNKDAVRQLGFNWAIGASDWSRDFFFANNVAQLNPTVYSSNGLGNILAPNPLGQLTYSVAAVGNGGNTNVTFGFPRAEFQMFMQALRQNSLARVLAEPNLVAISGQTATFLAGGEVPIPVTQGGAVAGAITIEYKEFGIRLAFTPTVLGGQVIRLHVMSEVSDAVPGGALAGGLPLFSFVTRRVESTVECGNGQTFAIAGLLSERVQSVVEKIPGLGDLPVLGALFSSVDYQRNNTELVILVTPQLVEPLDPQQVPPVPGSEMTHPDDYELFALGQLEGKPRPAPESVGVPRESAPVNTPPGVTTTRWPTSQMTLRGPWGFADFDEN